MRFAKSIIPAVILFTLFTQIAVAQEDAAEEKTYGINVDLGFATIYNFRGLNTFADSSQMDQNGAFFPSVTWSILDTGVYLGYWGAYQLSGHNIAANVRDALGHEQDLYVGYEKSFGKDEMFTFTGQLTYFFYPFATWYEEPMGNQGKKIGNPSLIEPLVGLSVATGVDLGLNFSWFQGLDDSTKGLSHLYIRPTIAKSISLGDRFGLDMGFGAGFKVFLDSDTDKSNNAVDLSFDFALPIALEGSLYATPAVSLVWTNLNDLNAGDEYMVYGSLNIGADF